MKELQKLKQWLENRLNIAQTPVCGGEKYNWEAKAEAYEAVLKKINSIESELFSAWYENLSDADKESYCKIYWLNK